MCGRYTISDPTRIAQRFPGYQFKEEFAPDFNVAPTRKVPGVTNDRPKMIGALRWGLIPGWATDERFGLRTINARAENVAESRVYRGPFRRQRCLLFADGFYEWRMVGKDKQPVHFRMLDQMPFAFAGLWDRWRAPDGSTVRSAAIITTEANALVRQTHARMPVILPEAHFDAWLDPNEADTDALRTLLQPYPAHEMLAVDVNPLVNKIHNNSKDCLAPAFELQPPLMLGLQ